MDCYGIPLGFHRNLMNSHPQRVPPLILAADLGIRRNCAEFPPKTTMRCPREGGTLLLGQQIREFHGILHNSMRILGRRLPEKGGPFSWGQRIWKFCRILQEITDLMPWPIVPRPGLSCHGHPGGPGSSFTSSSSIFIFHPSLLAPGGAAVDHLNSCWESL